MNYQLVLQFPEGDLDWLIEIEDKLEKRLSMSDIDGHDIGNGQMNCISSDLIHSLKTHLPDQQEKPTNAMKPVYTIPVNATLTGATLMTPLVGRIPIDGKLTSPYHFKLVLSASNLTANGYPLPEIKGAVGPHKYFESLLNFFHSAI